MEHTIARFAKMLRASGVMVSPAETVDCVQALPWINLFDSNQFHTTLKAFFVKSPKDSVRFDRCFELFFSHQDPVETLSEMDKIQETESDRPIEFAEQWKQEWENRDSWLSPEEDTAREISDFILHGREGILERIDQLRMGETRCSSGKLPASGIMILGQKLRIWRSIDQIRGQLHHFFDQKVEEYPDIQPEILRSRERYDRQLKMLDRMLYGETTTLSDHPRIYRSPVMPHATEHQRSLVDLYRTDQEKLLELMTHLIRKITTAQALRQRRKKHGNID
ncbi:MAG: hypothetical protein HQM12_19205, partial [SAR324 cluster bacterium]|nr:hypothetical protein [SAR324 cluster bacterium]